MLARRLEVAQSERIAELANVAIFADLGNRPKALAELAGLMTDRVYQPGESILIEGEPGAEMYLLIEGDASVHKSTLQGDHYKVAILSGGHHTVIGEGALLDADARSATIRAETVCRCWVLSRAAFDQFTELDPSAAVPVLRRIAQAVMGRLKKTNGDLLLVYNALISEIRGE